MKYEIHFGKAYPLYLGYDKEHKEIDEIADDTTLIKIDDERFIIQQY